MTKKPNPTFQKSRHIRRCVVGFGACICCAAMLIAGENTPVKVAVFNDTLSFTDYRLVPSSTGNKAAIQGGTNYYWVYFSNVMPGQIREQIGAIGGMVLEDMGPCKDGFLYKIGMFGHHAEVIAVLRTCTTFQNLVPIAVGHKVDSAIWNEIGLSYVDSGAGLIKVQVRFYSPISRVEAEKVFKGYVRTILPSEATAGWFVVIASVTNLLSLALADEVKEITICQ